MFGIGVQELLIIAVIALLIIGPKKLPDMAKTIGRGLSEFRKAADGVTDDIKQTIKDVDEKSSDDGFKDSLLMKKTNSTESQADSVHNTSKK